MLRIGVDVGGTFTDAVAASGTGELVVSKALSTPGREEQGVLDALDAVAARLDEPLGQALARTELIAHGTTVGLNAVLTRSGARVGLITTLGFESTLAVAKANKLHGLREEDVYQPVRWDKPAPLVDRRLVVGVAERIDACGEVVVPLDERSVADALAVLRSRGAESLAVSLLWSVVNPAHEQQVAAIVRSLAPSLHLSLSSELAPRIGEYERSATVALDAYVAPVVASYLGRLEGELCSRGFAGSLVALRLGGGVQAIAEARRAPVQTLRSGPAGGVAATQKLGEVTGRRNLIATDVGGTTFDVGLVIDGEPEYTRTPTIERHRLALTAVDLVSIGTGGGSIAWYDTDLGALRVGPASAGARPGPACYGRGGTLPTVTDAAAVLGYVDRLGGTLHLDVARAASAVETHVAHHLGAGLDEAAEGIVTVACEQMRDLIRRTTIGRGHNPADFTLVVYGGAGPQYAWRYADGLGVPEVVVPALAAELSALGAIASDLRAVEERDLRPGPLGDCLDAVNGTLVELAELVVSRLATPLGTSGDTPDPLTVRRSVGLRFYRQVHHIDVPTGGGTIGPAQAKGLIDEFRRRYERLVGPGSAFSDTPVEVVSVGVEALRQSPPLPPHARNRRPAAPRSCRAVHFDGAEVETPVYVWDDLATEQVLVGPALVDSETTTLVVPPAQTARVDESGDVRLALVAT